MVRRDRLVQARLKLASCWVAHIFSVIGNVDDTVVAHLRWTDSTTSDLAVVCLALELPTRPICRLVVGRWVQACAAWAPSPPSEPTPHRLHSRSGRLIAVHRGARWCSRQSRTIECPVELLSTYDPARRRRHSSRGRSSHRACRHCSRRRCLRSGSSKAAGSTSALASRGSLLHAPRRPRAHRRSHPLPSAHAAGGVGSAYGTFSPVTGDYACQETYRRNIDMVTKTQLVIPN